MHKIKSEILSIKIVGVRIHFGPEIVVQLI